MTNLQHRFARIGMCFLLTIAALTMAAKAASGEEVDGFTEPYKTVSVAAVETGTIKTIDVREGDTVTKGQVVAHLDDDVYQALRDIAEMSMKAQGQLKSAQAEVAMRHARLEKLETLREHGHARQEEVERARADLEIAEAHVLSAREQLDVKRLEYQKVVVQLKRRVVHSPVDGVVSFVHKDEGEFVAPNDPHVLEIVCLDPLTATFNVPSYLARRLQVDEQIGVYLEDVDKWVEGKVALVAPVTDAESSTVRVKVNIANSERKYHSGERCTLQLTDRARPGKRRQARP